MSYRCLKKNFLTPWNRQHCNKKKKKKLQSDFVSKNPSSVKVKIVIQVKYSFTRSLRTVGSLFPSFFFCQEDILYKSKLYKYTSSSAVIEVIVAQKNN